MIRRPLLELRPDFRAAGLAVAVLLGLLAISWPAGGCAAHEVRPAYLELREVLPGEFDVLLKVPMNGALRLRLEPSFAARIEQTAPVAEHEAKDAAVRTWRFRALEPLRGRVLAIEGLQSTMTDALVQIAFMDSTTWVRRLTPQEPAATIPVRQSGWSVAGVYLKLGVEHILLGLDHLLSYSI
jgi:hypothetical protein